MEINQQLHKLNSQTMKINYHVQPLKIIIQTKLNSNQLNKNNPNKIIKCNTLANLSQLNKANKIFMIIF